ncbi:hypothetical protein D3C76_1717530 [compost metagenome]
MPHYRAYPGCPEVIVGDRQPVIRKCARQLFRPEQPAQGVVTAAIGLAGIVAHQFRRQFRHQPLERTGEFTQIVQGQEEHAQPFDHRQ